MNTFYFIRGVLLKKSAFNKIFYLHTNSRLPPPNYRCQTDAIVDISFEFSIVERFHGSIIIMYNGDLP